MKSSFSNEQPPLSADMIMRIQAAVAVVAAGGWGRVVIVVEKSAPRRLEVSTDEWLIKREP